MVLLKGLWETLPPYIWEVLKVEMNRAPITVLQQCRYVISELMETSDGDGDIVLGLKYFIQNEIINYTPWKDGERATGNI